MYYPFDWTIIIVIPGLLLGMWAQAKVQGTFKQYSEVRARNGMTASEVSERLISQNSLNVTVRPIAGDLTDNYDPRNNTLSLSQPVYSSPSIAAIGVAAHEVGHAIQHKDGYAPLAIRNAIVPVVNLGSMAALPLFLIGLLFAFPKLTMLGIVLFAGVLLFHLVTLPVEINASKRAIAMLSNSGILSSDELPGAKKVLSAAAMTYISAAVVSALNLVRLIALRNSSNRN